MAAGDDIMQLKYKMFCAKIKSCLFKTIIELFVFNRVKRSKLKARFAKKYLRKYADIAIMKVVSPLSNRKDINTEPDTDSDYIWQYWQQGVGNAPLLIQRCLESTEKYHSDKKIIVLDKEKIQDYVELPSKYYDLLNQGKMKPAFFSDILRTYLLTQYGGTWVDATIFFTGRIPDNILQSEFFVFQKNAIEDMQENCMSNYFIHSKPNNLVMEAIKCALNEYWNENDFVINYFMYEHIATLLSENKDIKKIFDEMPYYEVGAQPLRKILYEDFSEETFEKIKSQTNIHKLSYKIIRNDASENSYYTKIINGEI